MASIFVWLDILNGTVTAGLQVRMKMPWAALSMVVGKIVSVGLIVGLIMYMFPNDPQGGFFPIVLVSIVGALLTLLLSCLFVSRFFGLWPRWDWVASRKLLYEAFPFALALGLHTFYLKSDMILFSMLLPPSVNDVCMVAFCGDTEAGYYKPATAIMSLGLLIAVFFLNSLLPTLTDKIARAPGEMTRFLQQSLVFLFGLGVAAAAGLLLLSTEVTLIVAQPSFVGATDHALQILAMFLPLAFVSSFFSYLFIAHGQQHKLIWLSLGAVVFNFVGNLLVIPHFGLIGAATVSVVGAVMLMAATVTWALQMKPFPLPWHQLILIVIVGVGAAGIAFGWHQSIIHWPMILSFVTTGAIFTVLYATGLRLANVIHRDDITRLLKRSDSPQ